LPRVGSALDYLSAAIVALAVFALPISLIALTTGHGDWRLLVSFLLAGVVAVAAVVRLVAGTDWPSRLAAVIAMAAVTWPGGFVAFFIGFSIHISHSLCGQGPASGIGEIGAVVIYAAVGGWALTGSGPRFFLGPSAGAALGIAWALVAQATLPGGHGYCQW
jgi:hypothetical protein